MLKKSAQLVLLTGFIQFLTACGAGVNVAGNGGGISGTGITMGRITEFGSIYVNGIRFDIDSASFFRDGVASAGQEEFRIGEYVVITGSVDAATTSGIASVVVFIDQLEGAVTKVSTDNENIEILGQNVKVDPFTTFHDIGDLNSLVEGNIVEVSGVKDANGLIKATSITLKQETFVAGISENELKGTVSSINLEDKTLVINNILIDYSGAQLDGFDELKVSQFIEIKSNSSIIGNTLIANEIELEDELQDISENTEVEIEGIVTRFVSSADFDLNGRKVVTTEATKYENGLATDIRLNAALKIEGIIDATGTLVAEEIDFEDDESRENENDENSPELEGDETSSINNSSEEDNEEDEGEEGVEDENNNSEDDDSSELEDTETDGVSSEEEEENNNSEEDEASESEATDSNEEEAVEENDSEESESNDSENTEENESHDGDSAEEEESDSENNNETNDSGEDEADETEEDSES